MPRGLAASELLALWDRGQTLPPRGRARAMLEAGHDDNMVATIGRWTAGQCHAALLALRRRTFGSRLDAVAACPRCAVPLEMAIPIAELTAPFGTDATVVPLPTGEYRLPTLDDLDAATTAENLMTICRRTGEAPLDAVEEAMAAADPMGSIQLSLACDSCRHAWNEPFDVIDFVWQEIDRAARRLLQDVHILATAYSWREADILALSPTRRAMYLGMVSP